MEYINKDLGSYHLHLIKTDKFKTVNVRISFRSPIIKEEITIRNVLCDMFLQSSSKYPSKRDLTIAAQDLYAADIQTNNTRLGNYNNLDIYLSVLNDKYTEEGNFLNALKFLNEIVFHPDVLSHTFNEDKLDIVKNTTRSNLSSIKEDGASYSLLRLFEVMDKGRVSSYRMVGYLEDLEKITGKTLYDYYTKMIRSDLVDVFVVGDFDVKEMVQMIRENIPIKTVKREKVPYLLEDIRSRSRRIFVKEKIDTSQSKLAIGCRCHKLSSYERNYALTLYNVILGGSADSKLFREVREKYSLCYTINSVPNKLDRLLIIRAGIDKENYQKTLELIEKELLYMRKGNFSDDDIKVAKEYYLTALDEVEDNPNRIMDNYYMMELLGTDDIDLKRKNIMKVSKSDIMKVAKKIKMDTVFLLEGDSDEKN